MVGSIATINPPILKSPKGDAVVRFKVEYERYLRQVEHLNAGVVNEANKVKAVGYRSCISGELLEALTELEIFDGACLVSDVTDDMVKIWVESRGTCATNDTPAQVKNALGKVKFRADSKDPEGAVLAFFIDTATELRRNRASQIVKDNPKTLISLLIPKLEPVLVRETIADAYEFWSKEQKSNYKFFKTTVTTASIESAKYSKAFKKDRKKGNPREGARVTADEEKKDCEKDATPDPPREEKKKRKWKTPCLNPKCDDTHRVLDCPITSNEEAMKLIEARKSEKKKKKTGNASKACKAKSEGNGRYQVILPGSISYCGVGDYGSCNSAIPRELFNRIKEADSSISEKPLAAPIKLEAAFDLPSGVDFSASASTTLDILIELPCGKLSLRNVDFWIVNQTMNELLLGRPLLKCLGFDLDKLLHGLCLQGDEVDVASKLAEDLNNEEDINPKAAALKEYGGMWYNREEYDPVEPTDSVAAHMGEDTPNSINEAVKKTIVDARESGMSNEGLKKCEAMLNQYKDVLRIKLGADGPANVQPYEVTLKHGYRPYCSSQRRYALPQRAFIQSTVRCLEKIGAISFNPKSKWASPALAVPKPGTDRLRFTVDLRGVNKQTVPVAPAMPDLETLYRSIEGSSVFANIDMCHAYWQIPLDEGSREVMSIQTPSGVYTPNRILQGSTDAGNHFQAVTSRIFAELSSNMLQWLDDFLLHASGESELLEKLQRFFELCRQYKLKIHAEKMSLFCKSVKFCGRIIDKEGIQFDPRSLKTITTMLRPGWGAELQQFLCATNWMRSSIPNYSSTVAPLQKLIEQLYQKVGKRTKRAVSKLNLTELWGEEHDRAFESIKSFLVQSIKLSYPKSSHTMCLFTDASETHWSSILTQVPHNEIALPVENQSHQILSFLSGSFSKSAFRWSIVEKEAFAVVHSMSQLDYLTASGVVHLFTDHANLTYIFDPYGCNPGISKQVASKLMRWALKLSGYRYIIEFLPGDRNVWADILTRWGSTPTIVSKKSKLASLYAPVYPRRSREFDWPSKEDFIVIQRKSTSKYPKEFDIEKEVIADKRNRWWIPDDHELLKLRVLIAAHTGMAGHRSSTATFDAISKEFWWSSMKEDVQKFCNSCIHCLTTSSGTKVPRPLGHAMHASKPNEIIHFDFCYIGKSNVRHQYVLIIKDDLTSYTWLYACEAADAETVVDALVDWFAAFGPVKQWISDQGSHFKNRVMDCLREKLHCLHHFTLPYCPWSNGSVEVVCRELQRALRSLVSEASIPMTSWPSVLPLVQSVLNSGKLKRLGNRSPLMAFTGHDENSPLLQIKRGSGMDISFATISEVRTLQLVEMDKLLSSVDAIHREVQGLTSKARKKRVDQHNRRTNVKPCNFEVGDFVLRANSSTYAKSKVSVKWYGPLRITKVMSDYLFEVEDLLSGTSSVSHGSKLKIFRNKEYKVSEEILEHLSFQSGEYCVIDELVDIRKRKSQVQILVSWKGFADEDPEWIEINKLKEDVPVLVNEFINELHNTGTKTQKRILQSLLN